MSKQNYPITFVATLLIVSTTVFVEAETEWKTGLDTITAGELRSMVYFLASDEMEGRDTATLTNKISSRYIGHQFELMGLEPVGDGEDYFQYLTVVQSRLTDTNELEFQRGESPLSEVAVLREDFFPATLSGNGKVTAPLVLAGYGITAPELNFDEYTAIEAHGKIVVLYTGLPKSDSDGDLFSSGIRSDYVSDFYKLTNAQAHGAVGTIFVYQSDDRSLSSAARRAWPEKADPEQFDAKLDIERIRIPAVFCAQAKLASLLQGSEDLKTLKEEIDRHQQPKSRPLVDLKATIETKINRKETLVRNVLAFLPGSDPVLKNEIVIVGAHFDHLGKRNGQVYRGADDNASGTAGVLEIAEAFSGSPNRCRRSLLFALWNAEEKGLIGSRHYTEEPPVPLEKTVALYQLDMIGRNQQVDSSDDPKFRGLEKQTAENNEETVHLIGYSYSEDMTDLVKKSNEFVGLELRFELDNHPLNLIRRSDHWPFLVRGIPVLFLTTGFHPDYHTPADTADKLNYSKMERVVRLAFLCAWDSANSDNRSRLNRPGGGL